MVGKIGASSSCVESLNHSNNRRNESSKIGRLAKFVFTDLPKDFPTVTRTLVISSLMFPIVWTAVQIDVKDPSQEPVSSGDKIPTFAVLSAGFGMLMGSMKISQLSLLFFLPALLPGVSAQDCIQFPNGTIAPDPVFQYAPDVVEFFGYRINGIPKPINSYGNLIYGNPLLKVFRSLSPKSQLKALELSWNGFRNPKQMHLGDQVNPENRAFLRWITTIFIGEVQPQLSSVDSTEETCVISSPSLKYCSTGRSYSCEDNTLKGLFSCVDTNGTVLEMNSGVYETDLSAQGQCGKQTFNQSSILENYFVGDDLLPYEQCRMQLKGLSISELSNLGSVIKNLIADSGSHYSSFSTLYGLVKNEYEIRMGGSSEPVMELDPCPTGNLPCNINGTDNCDGGEIIDCSFPSSTIAHEKSLWGPLPPPKHRSSRTPTSTGTVSKKMRLRTDTPSKGSGSASRDLTFSDTGTKSKWFERTISSISRIFTRSGTIPMSESASWMQSRTHSLPLPLNGNCTLYAQYLQNPAISAVLNGITCGPGGSTRVDLRGRGLTASQAEIIAPALDQLTNITEMIIFSNNFGPNGTVAIAESIGRMPSLTYLHATDNQIGDLGAAAFARALNRQKQLVLILYQNNIGPLGGRAIAQALRNMDIKELYLQNNHIGDEACLEIADAVNHSPFPSIVTLAPNDYNATTQAKLKLILANVSSVNV